MQEIEWEDIVKNIGAKSSMVRIYENRVQEQNQ